LAPVNLEKIKSMSVKLNFCGES